MLFTGSRPGGEGFFLPSKFSVLERGGGFIRREVAAGFEDGIGALHSNRVGRGGDVGLWDREPSSAEPDSLRCRRHRSRSRRDNPEPGMREASAGWGELRRWRSPKKWGTAKSS